MLCGAGEVDGVLHRKRSSDGALVRVGKADAKGANGNNDNPRNRRANLGVSFSRSFYSAPSAEVSFLRECIQPPSILPISTSCSYVSPGMDK